VDGPFLSLLSVHLVHRPLSDRRRKIKSVIALVQDGGTWD
jgi:hypothetical protein